MDGGSTLVPGATRKWLLWLRERDAAGGYDDKCLRSKLDQNRELVYDYVNSR